jgi:RNA polymerase-associated protein RTF1
MMADMGLVVPKLAALDKKLDILRAFVSRKLTDREITDMIDRRNMLRRKYDPAQRESVEQALQEAKVQNNQILTNQLEQELASLGKPGGLAFRTSLTPAKPTMTNSAQQERLAELNRENRRRNVEAVRKAQLKERHRAREIEAAIARGEAVQEDPSRRLKTKAKFVHDVNDSMTVKKTSSANGSGASTPANGTPKLGAQKHALLPQIAKLQEQRYAETKGIPTIHKPLLDDDIIGALDLDIDIDID